MNSKSGQRIAYWITDRMSSKYHIFFFSTHNNKNKCNKYILMEEKKNLNWFSRIGCLSMQYRIYHGNAYNVCGQCTTTASSDEREKYNLPPNYDGSLYNMYNVLYNTFRSSPQASDAYIREKEKKNTTMKIIASMSEWHAFPVLCMNT